MTKFDRLPQPFNFQDLSKKDETVRLNRELKGIVTGINDDRTIQAMPMPGHFSGTFSRTGQAGLWWDDVDDALRPDLDGARIWRAEAATDPDTNFSINTARAVLVSCTRTTRYVDLEVDSGSAYIYWVQWVNVEGMAGRVAGGLSGTIT